MEQALLKEEPTKQIRDQIRDELKRELKGDLDKDHAEFSHPKSWSVKIK